MIAQSFIAIVMNECTSEVILREFLYHCGLEAQMDEIIAHAIAISTVMPYITSQFMPRTLTDRPAVIPQSSANLTFIGQFVELEGDVVFTVETSMRTAMIAVYKLLHLDRLITSFFQRQYDIRMVNVALHTLLGKDEIDVSDLPKINPLKIHSMQKEFVDFVNAIPPVPEY
ncbi:MAG: oleate hydratase [Aerococcus sp.]|nr:oleate hydratase [Aerococcus sp.]